MIKLTNLTKVYETTNHNVIALSDLNYSIDIGEVVVLLGKSGSGKSTLLNILGGFDTNYAGHYLLDDEDMKQKDEHELDEVRKRKIGFVFQHYVLLNNLTIVENVELALRAIGVLSNLGRRRAAVHALDLVGLSGHEHKYPYQLSGGQRQRVSLARAFVKNPSIMIADEPTAALDTKTSKEVLDLLVDLCRNKLLIIATHNKSIVRDYGTRVIELKSGYTVRNDLILADKSNIEVDDLDKLIDSELGIVNIASNTNDSDLDIEKTLDNSVLGDLGVDLSQFKSNVTDKHKIDQDLKQKMIEERKSKSLLKTRIYRFISTTETFYGKKQYSFKAFFRNIGLHIFSAIIFAMFLFVIIFGFNFVGEAYSGFNEVVRYNREIENNTYVYFVDDQYGDTLYSLMIEYAAQIIEEGDDFELVSDYDLQYEIFTRNFQQTEIESNSYIYDLLEDPFYQYSQDQAYIEYLANGLDGLGYQNSYSVYYSNSSIVEVSVNPEIVFEDLQYVYTNIVTNPTPLTYVDSVATYECSPNVIDQYNYIFVEGNKEILEDHLIQGSSLPSSSTEIAIPISYLFDYEILDNGDFLDEYGNVMEVIPSELVYKRFKELPVEDKLVTITVQDVTISDSAIPGVYNIEETPRQVEFSIVGLLNLESDLNPFLSMDESVFTQNASDSYFSFVFSNKSNDLINFTIDNQSEDSSLSKVAQVINIEKDVFSTTEVQALITGFYADYRDTAVANISADYQLWIDDLNSARELLYDYVILDIDGNAPSGFLSQDIDSEYFDITYEDLLYSYVAQHATVIYDTTEFEYIYPTGEYIDRSYTDAFDDASIIYENLKTNEEYVDALLALDDGSRLTYQESTNRIIYLTYGKYFSNELYYSESGALANITLTNSFVKNEGLLTSIIVDMLPIPIGMIYGLPYGEYILNSIVGIENSDIFKSFTEATNLDLVIKSMSTNATKSVIMISILVILYVLLLISIVALCFVLVNLYGNIYDTATQKRIGELSSLRILGTSEKDIKSMILIECKILSVITYGIFIGVLFIVNQLDFFKDIAIYHYYMPLLQLFFDFNIYNVLKFDIFGIILVTALYYFFVYKFIIKRISLKKVTNIDPIKGIKGGDFDD